MANFPGTTQHIPFITGILPIVGLSTLSIVFDLRGLIGGFSIFTWLFCLCPHCSCLWSPHRLLLFEVLLPPCVPSLLTRYCPLLRYEPHHNSPQGMCLSLTAVAWATLGATRLFDAKLKLTELYWLVAYPTMLFYSCFVLITVF